MVTARIPCFFVSWISSIVKPPSGPIKTWILDIDDNDDLEQQSSEFDLDSGVDETETFDFKIPYNIDDSNYDIQVRVKGEEEDNPSNKFEVIGVFKGGVEVEKEGDEFVIFESFSLDTETVECGSFMQTSMNVINIGTDDLDNMYLGLEISELNLKENTAEFDLDSDKYDDREKKETITMNIPKILNILMISAKKITDKTVVHI